MLVSVNRSMVVCVCTNCVMLEPQWTKKVCVGWKLLFACTCERIEINGLVWGLLFPVSWLHRQIENFYAVVNVIHSCGCRLISQFGTNLCIYLRGKSVWCFCVFDSRNCETWINVGIAIIRAFLNARMTWECEMCQLSNKIVGSS